VEALKKKVTTGWPFNVLVMVGGNSVIAVVMVVKMVVAVDTT